MKLILNNFDVDYVIKVPFADKINLSKARIMSTRDFLINDKIDKTKFEKANNVFKAVLYCEDVSFLDSDDDGYVYSKAHENKVNKEEIKFKLDKSKSVISTSVNRKNQLEKISKSILNKKVTLSLHDGRRDSVDEKSTNVNSNENEILSKENKIQKSNKSSKHHLIYDLNTLESTLLDPKGIYNPSVYCFMNTCMQCLVSIPELNSYFLTRTYKLDIKNNKDISGCEALFEFIMAYSTAERRIKPPRSLYSVCHSFLEPQRQHDCQEFLRRFLSKLQEELNIKRKYTFPDKISHEKAWSIYREINPSIIDSLFTGLIRSSVYCNRCLFRSDTYDPFMDLSVPIHRKNRERLENCLENYFAKEFIDCEYKCSSCKKKTSVEYIISYLDKQAASNRD